MHDEPLGTVRVEEDLFPIVALDLAGGAINVTVRMQGPVSIRNGAAVMLHGNDGRLVCRGQLGAFALGPNETAELRYSVEIDNKLTASGRGYGPARMVRR